MVKAGALRIRVLRVRVHRRQAQPAKPDVTLIDVNRSDVFHLRVSLLSASLVVVGLALLVPLAVHLAALRPCDPAPMHRAHTLGAHGLVTGWLIAQPGT